MSNEYDIIIFEDYKILSANEHNTQEDNKEDDEWYADFMDEVRVDNETNIYSDDHIWDHIPMRRYRHRPDVWLTEEELKTMWSFD